MSLLVDINSKEQQVINELQRKLSAKLDKQGKDETRQKILLGAFLLDLLEQDKVAGLRQYTVDNLDKFLSRDGDKTLLLPVVENVKKRLAHSEGEENLLADETETKDNLPEIGSMDIEAAQSAEEK